MERLANADHWISKSFKVMVYNVETDLCIEIEEYK